MLVPPFKGFNRVDYPDGQEWDKLIRATSPFLSSLSDALSRKLTFKENHAAQVQLVRVAMPATDWVTVGAAGAPAFGSGWADIAIPASYGVVGYRKDFAGNVWLRGYVLNTTGGNLGTTAYTLPSGFRPGGGAVFTSGGAALVYITSAGLVAPNVAVAASGFFGTWCSFECADRSPWVPGCFPIDFACTLPMKPSGIQVLQVVDINDKDAALAMGAPDWKYAPKADRAQVRIKNLPGLLYGHTYDVTLLVTGGDV